MARNFQIGGTHAAPPGSSLTQENNAWGNPPPITEVKDLYNKVRTNCQNPVLRNRLKKMMYAGVDISVLAETTVRTAFAEKLANPDVLELAKPSIYAMFVAMSQEDGYNIPVNLGTPSEEDERITESKEDYAMLKIAEKNNPTVAKMILMEREAQRLEQEQKSRQPEFETTKADIEENTPGFAQRRTT